MDADSRRALTEHRKRLRLSRPEVARRSGLSVSAVKAYETGTRHPSREALTAIIDSLGLTKAEAGPLLAGAGYATNWRAIFHETYGPRGVEWFAAEVQRSAWPAFVTNEASDLIAANGAFRALVGMPARERLPDPDRWNLFALLSSSPFAERIENWDEVMSFVLGLGKAGLRREVNPERPPPWVAEPLQRFLQGRPAFVTRMLKLWEPAEPVEHTTRMRCPMRWRHEGGQLMRFSGLIHVADVWQVFAWHDWIPEDAETMRLLGDLTAGR
jgi:transcriptional regulator with XRE-family HTH domain